MLGVSFYEHFTKFDTSHHLIFVLHIWSYSSKEYMINYVEKWK